MTPQLQQILAQAIVDLMDNSLNEKNSYFIFKDKKLVEEGALSYLEKIEQLFKMGVNPLTIVNIENNEPSLLINKMLYSSMNDNLLKIAFKYMNKEQLQEVPNEVKLNILDGLIETGNIKNVESFFEKGFRLNPGVTDSESIECELATRGNLEFFEVLKYYQPDYNLNHVYESVEFKEKVTLSDLINYELDFETGQSKEKLQNLKSFINANNLHEKLQNDIEDKSIETLKIKI